MIYDFGFCSPMTNLYLSTHLYRIVENTKLNDIGPIAMYGGYIMENHSAAVKNDIMNYYSNIMNNSKNSHLICDPTVLFKMLISVSKNNNINTCVFK